MCGWGGGGGVLAWELHTPVADKPHDLGRFIFKEPKDHPLVCKRSRRVIGLNGALACFTLFLNVRASLRGNRNKHTVL